MKCIACGARIWERNVRCRKYGHIHTVTNLGVFRSHKKPFAICKTCWINPKHKRVFRRMEERKLRREDRRKIYEQLDNNGFTLGNSLTL